MHRRLLSAAGALKATSSASSGHLGQKDTCVYNDDPVDRWCLRVKRSVLNIWYVLNSFLARTRTSLLLMLYWCLIFKSKVQQLLHYDNMLHGIHAGLDAYYYVRTSKTSVE